MALTSKQKLAKKSKLAKKQNDVPQPVSTHAPCTKRRGKAWYRQECLPELASGWRELQEHTPAHSGRELLQQGHEIPCEDLLPQCSTPSSVQGQSQGKGSLAQTCRITSLKYSSSNAQSGASYTTGAVFSLAFQK